MTGRIKDLTGMVFGQLTAVSPTGRTSGGNTIWFCACLCGRQTEVRASNLMQGVTKSCGCKRSQVLREAARARNPKKRKSRIWSDTFQDDVQEFLS